MKVIYILAALFILLYLYRRYNISKNRKTSLIYHACKGEIDKIEDLIKLGVNINAQCNYLGKKNSALLQSVHNHQVNTVEYLLRAGANPNIFNAKGETPLMVAIIEYDFSQKENVENALLKIINLLLSTGAEPNIQNRNGETPLIKAIQNSRNNISKILLKAGADPNLKDRIGYTPLMHAVSIKAYSRWNEPRKLKIIDYLLEHRADLNAKSNKNKTALDIATEESMGRFKMRGEISAFVNKLLSAGADYDIDWSEVKYSK